MAIYMVQMGEGGPVKVGYTSRLKARLKSFRCDWPYPSIVLATADGDGGFERALHWHLAADYIRSEWFRPSDAVMEAARGLAAGRLTLLPRADKINQTYAPRLRRAPTDAQLAIRAICQRFGSPGLMQKALGIPGVPGVPGVRVSGWISNGQIPPKYFPAIAEAAAERGFSLTIAELSAIARQVRSGTRSGRAA